MIMHVLSICKVLGSNERKNNTTESPHPVNDYYKKDKINNKNPAVLVNAFNPSTWEAWAGRAQFEDNLVYKLSSRTVKATHRDPSRKTKTKKQKPIKVPNKPKIPLLGPNPKEMKSVDHVQWRLFTTTKIGN